MTDNKPENTTAGLVDAFQRDGFVHVCNVLNADEVARFRAAVDEAVVRRKRNDTRTLEEKSPYEQSFLQCQYVWEDFPAIRGLTFHPKIGRLAARLLGAERVRLWHDQALYKEAGGRETEAHQDFAYWPIAEPDEITAWIPLVAVNEQMGCMGYVPGSHLGECEFIDIFNSPGAGAALQRKFAERPPVFVPCNAGDVIFHHSRTVHMAKPNRSPETRRVYTAIYFRDGCTRARANPHTSLDRDNIAVGAAIDGRATPIVWPLAGGALPEPGPWPSFGANRILDHAARMGIFPGGSAQH